MRTFLYIVVILLVGYIFYYVKVASKQYKGNPPKNKDQYANMYNKSHDTKQTAEMPQGTQLINQPTASQTIINAEDPT